MTFPGWVGNVFLVVAAIYVVWKIAGYAMSLSQFKPMDVVWGIVILFVVFITLTNRQSPINAVRVVDTGYSEVYGELGQTKMMADVVSAFGQKPESFGLSGPNAAQNPQIIGVTPVQGPSVVIQATPMPGSFGVTTVVQQTSGFAPMGFTIPADKHLVAWDASGVQQDISGVGVCLDGWNSDSTVSGCMGQDGWKISFSADFSGLPANPYATASSQTTQPQVSGAELDQAKAACWMTWAGTYLTGTTAEWGAQALPVGTQWDLKGPGGFTDGNFTGKAKEQWSLSSRELGITDFPINGYVARAFGNADDSATVIVYGTNPNIWAECVKLAQ